MAILLATGPWVALRLIQHPVQTLRNVPASLADAALVRMSEIVDGASLLTTDSDFYVYRRHGRQSIPVIHP